MNIVACEAEIRGPAATDEWKNVFGDLFAWATQTEGQDAAIYNNTEETSMFTSCAVLFCNQNFATAPAA